MSKITIETKRGTRQHQRRAASTTRRSTTKRRTARHMILNKELWGEIGVGRCNADPGGLGGLCEPEAAYSPRPTCVTIMPHEAEKRH